MDCINLCTRKTSALYFSSAECFLYLHYRVNALIHYSEKIIDSGFRSRSALNWVVLTRPWPSPLTVQYSFNSMPRYNGMSASLLRSSHWISVSVLHNLSKGSGAETSDTSQQTRVCSREIKFAKIEIFVHLSVGAVIPTGSPMHTTDFRCT